MRYATLFFALCTSLALAAGHLQLNIAVLAYNPIMENRPFNQRLHQACGWSNPLTMARDHTNWWDQASRGMVRCQIVTQVVHDIWPLMSDGFRYTDESYWAVYTNGWQGAHKPERIDFAHAFTNDAPWLLPMIERGSVDQVWMYLFPYVIQYETRLFGAGAYGCNSPGTDMLGNQRLFMVNFPSFERPDTPMENFGHGAESVLAGWFWNHLLDYPGWVDAPYTNLNDFALFTRALSNGPANVHCGNVHFAPNSFADYEWGSTRQVLSHADAWYSYPLMTNAPRLMNRSEWGNGVNHLHKIWWFKHMPQKVGLWRGRLMNWLTYYLNLNRASYPVGSHQELQQDNVDLAGWFTFEIFAPPGTTQITMQVNAGRGVQFGVRKDFIPLNNRFNWWSANNAAHDVWDATRATAHTCVIDAAHDYGRGVTGYWYMTFGNAYSNPRSRPVDSATNYRVLVTLSPQPTNAAPPALTVAAPAEMDHLTGRSAPIAWSCSGLPQGVRAWFLAYTTNAPDGPWFDICEDYHYQLSSPYAWSLPARTSAVAQVRVIAEDVYGVQYTNTSGIFGLRTPPVPEPLGGAALLTVLGAQAARRTHDNVR